VLPDECVAPLPVGTLVPQPRDGGARKVERSSRVVGHDLHHVRVGEDRRRGIPMLAADAREGVSSFLEKRPARFAMSPTQDLPPFYPWWPERTFR